MTEQTAIVPITLDITKIDTATYLVKRGPQELRLMYGHDWGPPFPGSDRDSLLQPGAQKLNKMLGVCVRPSGKPERTMDLEKGFMEYDYQVELVSLDTDRIEAYGVGSCNSWESKYRYRNKNRVCPECQKETIYKSKYPDKKTKALGYYCHKKAGGCGANFGANDGRILNQQVGKVQNPDPADQFNTIKKMAFKRAHTHATCNHSCVSDIFTQDAEDFQQSVDMGTGEIIETTAEVISEEPAKEEKPPVQKPSQVLDLMAKLRARIRELKTMTNQTEDEVFQSLMDSPKAQIEHIAKMSSPARVVQMVEAIEKADAWLMDLHTQRGAKNENTNPTP